MSRGDADIGYRREPFPQIPVGLFQGGEGIAAPEAPPDVVHGAFPLLLIQGL